MEPASSRKFLVIGLLLTSLSRVSPNSFGTMKTLFKLGFRNESTFTNIQEDVARPGIIIAILSNAIVQLDITDQQDLKLIAGIADESGYRGGYGGNIRFSTPSDLVQLNQNKWIISDKDNNCLRTFHPSRNERNEVAIRDWSHDCTNETMSSSVTSSLRTSFFYRPRALTYVPEENKIYVTYEKPYSIAAIYTDSERVVILYSSTNWQLRHVIHFYSELVISTEPSYYMFSLRDSQVGLIVDEFSWNSNVPSVRYTEYSAGIVALPGETAFLETMSNSHVLAYIDQESQVITKVCTGVKGHVDSELGSCQLDTPTSVTRINNTLYIGESGWSGGGIRYIELHLPDEIKVDGSQKRRLIIGLSVSAGIIVAIAVICGLILYRRWKSKMRIQPPEAPAAPPPTTVQPVRPVPAPRLYGLNSGMRAPVSGEQVEDEDYDDYNSYAYIPESRITSRYGQYEHATTDSLPRPYSDLFPTVRQSTSDNEIEENSPITLITESGMVIYTGKKTTDIAQELSEKLSEEVCKSPEVDGYEGPDYLGMTADLNNSTKKLSCEPSAQEGQLSVDLPSETEDSDDGKISPY
ncbi:uncharacterized protein [Watersipora subatra]|uniref:uncharacterized protein n=1 Tax=Watersipora subatra TaxID=2589382 RepID=UPI00355C41F5